MSTEYDVVDKQSEALILLQEIKDITRQIENLQNQIDEIQTMLTSTTVQPKDVDVQTSTAADPMADRIILRIEYEQKLESAQQELIQRKKKALDILRQLDAESQNILYIKYFTLNSAGRTHTLEQMAERLKYSPRATWTKIHDAEVKFCQLYESTF